MTPKRLISGLLALAFAVTIGPTSAAATTGGTAAQPNLSPASVTTPEGIVLTKTAERTAKDEWEITLTATGGETLATNNPIEIALVLDASSSMNWQASNSGKTKIAVAKQAARSLLETLANQKVDAKISITTFNWSGTVQQSLIPLLNANGTVNENNYNKLLNTINNKWKLDDYTNIKDGLEKGQSTFGNNSIPHYIVLLSDGDPTVYFSGGYVYLYNVEKKTKDYVDALLRSANAPTKLYAVGFDVETMKDYASLGCSYTANANSIGGVLVSIANSISQTVQNPVVTDAIGNNFALKGDQSNITITPTTQSNSTVTPGVTVSGKTIAWTVGGYLQKNETARMVYTVKLADSTLANADTVVPLNESASIAYDYISRTGSAAKTAAFPRPTALYEAGTLKVTSEGLPANTTGTTQTIGKTLVYDGQTFSVNMPKDAPKGYELKAIKVNKLSKTIDQFKGLYPDYANAVSGQKNSFTIPVVKGETEIVYCYGKVDKTVIFDAKGGTLSDGKATKEYTVQVGDDYPSEADPTRAGYSFVKWNPAVKSGKVQANQPASITHEAIWQANKTANISLYKYGVDAQNALITAAFNLDGKPLTANEANKNYAVGALEFDTVYKIEEITPPAGYAVCPAFYVTPYVVNSKTNQLGIKLVDKDGKDTSYDYVTIDGLQISVTNVPDESKTLNYTVEYYKDSVAEANKFEVSGVKTVPVYNPKVTSV
ncbi:MAG: VWA domain-containing protein, partial [Oscillospiraceae bacterium]|nr:VWA domain-containing protein [Oscillospiraceae bacterium]